MSHRQMKSGVGRSVARLGAGGTASVHAAPAHSIYGLYGAVQGPVDTLRSRVGSACCRKRPFLQNRLRVGDVN
jgi:hypothetical protein